MSLINNQLKSVTQRNRKPQAKPSLKRMGKGKNDLLFVVSLVALCVLMLVTIWIYSQRKIDVAPPTPAKEVAIEVVKHTPIEEKPEPIPAMPEPEPAPQAQPAPAQAIAPAKPKAPAKPTKRRGRHARLIVPTPHVQAEEPPVVTEAAQPVQQSNKKLLDLYQKAGTHMDRGHVDKAIQILDSKDIEKATQGQSGLMLAKALMQTQEVYKAREILHRIAGRYKAIKAQALLLTAHIYWHEKQYQKAIDALMKEMPAIEKHTEYYSFMAQAYLKTGKPDLAATVYNKLLEINALNAHWWIGLGMAYQSLKRYDFSKDAFEKAAKYEQKNAQLINLAQAKVKEVEDLKQQESEKTAKGNTQRS